MTVPILEDLKLYLSEVDGQKLTEKLWYIPRKKCIELNRKMRFKEKIDEEDVAFVDEPGFFNLSLLRSLSEVSALVYTDEKNIVLKVNWDNAFFSLSETEQLDRLFFDFFVSLDKVILYPFDCPVEKLLNTKAKFIADYLFEKRGEIISSDKIAKKILEGEKFEFSNDTILWHANYCVKIYFDALEYFGAVKRKGADSIFLTEQGKELLEKLFKSPMFDNMIFNALNSVVEFPLIDLLEPTTDITALRKKQLDTEKFFHEYEGFFLAIESTILAEYEENPSLLDKEVTETLGHLKEKMREEEKSSKLEKNIRTVLKVTVANQKALHGTALSMPELKAILARIMHWAKNHSDEGKQGYLNYLKAFFEEKLKTEEDRIKYLEKIGYKPKFQ